MSDRGTFVAVQQILGARTPSLFGNNQAVFSLTLSQEGATLLESAFAQGAAPIGVIYSLTFTAMQPALDVRITADFERIYEHFSAGLNANIYYVEIGIQAGIEELVQNGAIRIEVTNYSTATDKAEQEKMAIDFFTQNLLQSWFTPTLTPGTLQGGLATAPRAGGGAALFGPGQGQPGAATPGGTATGQPGASPGATPGATPPRPPTPPAPPGGATPPAAPGRPAAPTPGAPAAPTPAAPTPGAPAAPTPGAPAAPTPGGPGGPTPAAPTPAAPTPAAPTPRDLFVHFLEEGSGEGVHGSFTVSYSQDGAEHETTTPAGSASQLQLSVPASWTDGGLAVTANTLPELTLADADQVRRHATTGESILASGQRDAPLGMVLGHIAVPATGDLSATVRLPVTRTTVAAGSPDALVAAVFPGGHLVQPGIYDCRRIPGSNNFELITPGWPGALEPSTGGVR